VIGSAMPVLRASERAPIVRNALVSWLVDMTEFADHDCFADPHDALDPHRLFEAVNLEPSNGGVPFGA
jgi:hypothetical protein